MSTILSASSCKESSSLFASYKPPILPVEFTIDEDGVEISGSSSIVTPIGVFSIGSSNNFSFEENSCLYVTIKNYNTNKKRIYEIDYGKKLHLRNDGETDISMKSNSIEINVYEGESYQLVLTADDDSINIKKNFIEKFIDGIPEKDIRFKIGKELAKKVYDGYSYAIEKTIEYFEDD